MWDHWLPDLTKTSKPEEANEPGGDTTLSAQSSIGRRWWLPKVEWWRAALILVGLVVVIAGLTGLLLPGLATGKGSQTTLVATRSQQAAGSGPPSQITATNSAITSPSVVEKKLTIDVAGALVRPGVYQLPAGSRVADAISAAGGFASQADQRRIAQETNLAEPLKDGQKLYLPFKDEQYDQTKATTASTVASTTTNQSSISVISINTASLEQLDELPGIGAARAQKIIDNRPYGALNELVTREAITQKIFDQIEASLTL